MIYIVIWFWMGEMNQCLSHSQAFVPVRLLTLWFQLQSMDPFHKVFIIEFLEKLSRSHVNFNDSAWPRFCTCHNTLQWRHNEHDCVSNHQPRHCLLNRLFGCRSKKPSKLGVTGLCVGNSPGTGEFPAQKASNAENISIWWRHHELGFHGIYKIVSWTDNDFQRVFLWELGHELTNLCGIFPGCLSVNSGRYCFNQARMIALELDMNWQDHHGACEGTMVI